MLTVKKLLAPLAVALAFGASLPAQAIPVPGGPLTMHFTNWETRITAAGQILSGIFQIDQILSGSTSVWNSGDGGELLTGSFDNLLVTNYGGQAPGSQILFSGGTMQVWEHSTALAFNPANPGVNVNVGSLFLSLAFTTGGSADLFNPAVATSTLVANMGNVVTDSFGYSALQGQGKALLDVVGGTAATAFDTNTFNKLDGSGKADMSLVNSFFIRDIGLAGPPISINTPQNGWPVWSSDPISANAVPEPGSLALLGLALAGLGALRVRRQIC